MQRNVLRSAPEQAVADRRPSRRRIRAPVRSAGFFTIGFAIAVLAAGSLFAGATGTLGVTESASATAPGGAVVERTQPVDPTRAADASEVVISKAPSDWPNDARSGAASPQ
jgi:hypothetical protein